MCLVYYVGNLIFGGWLVVGWIGGWGNGFGDGNVMYWFVAGGIWGDIGYFEYVIFGIVVGNFVVGIVKIESVMSGIVDLYGDGY